MSCDVLVIPYYGIELLCVIFLRKVILPIVGVN